MAMTIRCPHCGLDIAALDKDIGTRLYHPPPRGCGGWLLIARRPDGSKYAIKTETPAYWPKEKRL